MKQRKGVKKRGRERREIVRETESIVRRAKNQSMLLMTVRVTEARQRFIGKDERKGKLGKEEKSARKILWIFV